MCVYEAGPHAYESEKIAKSFTQIRRNTEKLAETNKFSPETYNTCFWRFFSKFFIYVCRNFKTKY